MDKFLYTKCEKCGEEFYKYCHSLKFTLITVTPYVKCPYCGKKKYTHFK